MSMPKYLEKIKVPQVQPGPFELRLRYEMKKDYFTRRRTGIWPLAISTTMAVTFMVLFGFSVFSPTFNSQVQVALGNQPATPSQQILASDYLPLGEGQSLEPQRRNSNSGLKFGNNIKLVEDLTQIDPNRDYLIKKVRGNNNRVLYYVSEVEPATKQHKVMY